MLKTSVGTSGITNPLLTIIAQQNLLELTVDQSDSLAAMSRRYQYRADSLMMPKMMALAALPDDYDEGEARRIWLSARVALIAELERMLPAVNALLTPAQRRKLPQNTLNYLDPLWLAAFRNGTGTYVGVIR
jgi:hypothetical protein